MSAVLVERDECREPEVEYPTERAEDVGTAFGVVTVTLSCTVSNQGVQIVQPEPREIVVSASATVDLFRARSTP